MQIVIVTTWFPTARNPGAGSFIERDVRALSQEHDVRVVHLVPPELDDGVRQSRRGAVTISSIPVDVRTPRGLGVAMRRMPDFLENADLVHTMAAPALLAFLGRRPRVPWVHTEHWSGVANLRTSRKARYLLPISRRAFSGPDRVVCVSESLASTVRALRHGAVDVIGNIIDPVDNADPQSRLFFRPEAIKVLGVGTVNSHKGWRFAVNAVERLRDSGLDVHLVWLGHGPESAALQRIADDVIVTAPGYVPASEVRVAMRESDVFVLPTESETFSLVTIEALSSGTPVVATGKGAHTTFVAPGTGFIVGRDDLAIADGIREAHKLNRDDIELYGRSLVDSFSEEEFIVQYNRVYEEVLK